MAARRKRRIVTVEIETTLDDERLSSALNGVHFLIWAADPDVEMWTDLDADELDDLGEPWVESDALSTLARRKRMRLVKRAS